MVPSDPESASAPGPPGLTVVTRHRVAAADSAEFLAQARAAVALLGGRPGFIDASIARAIDDPDLLVLTTRWLDVGSYRRALSPCDVKMGAVPLLSTALDEPTAFEVLHARDGRGAVDTEGALAADADDVGLGQAAAVFVPRLPS